ncbi:permease [Legionella sp. km772]|nr:permease [Legionella sp. km772]
MEYQKVKEGSIEHDYFVDPQGIKPRIDLQEQLKEALRANTGRKKEINAGDFIIYLKKPPFKNESFLTYIPHQNGKHATQETPRIISGLSCSTYRSTSYGTLWHQITPLNAQRLEEVLAAREAQRDNRRHIGDSPLAT